MKIDRRYFKDAPHGSRIFEDIKTVKTQKTRLSRAGAQYLRKFMKINRRNFEDALHGSAIFEDIKTMRTQKRDCLERERNF